MIHDAVLFRASPPKFISSQSKAGDGHTPGLASASINKSFHLGLGVDYGNYSQGASPEIGAEVSTVIARHLVPKLSPPWTDTRSVFKNTTTGIHSPHKMGLGIRAGFIFETSSR
jgi:hypothetical protein